MYQFLCDEMLRGLARWLRAAGYDTACVVAGSRDRDIIDKARSEHRLLLSRDHKLLEMRHSEHVVLLQSNGLEAWVTELNRQFDMNWLQKPFSRCLLCNTVLVPAQAEQMQAIPRNSREHIDAAWFCKPCDKLYWQGAHTRRMYARLQTWQEGKGDQTRHAFSRYHPESS